MCSIFFDYDSSYNKFSNLIYLNQFILKGSNPKLGSKKAKATTAAIIDGTGSFGKFLFLYLILYKGSVFGPFIVSYIHKYVKQINFVLKN